MAKIFATPGKPATGLASKLDFYVDQRNGGPSQAERALLSQWAALRTVVYQDAVTLLAVPQTPGRPKQSCPHR